MCMTLLKCDQVHAPTRARLTQKYESCRQRLYEPSLALRLFFAAPLPQLQKLMQRGFDSTVLEPSADFGRGLYFSRYASSAHRFSGGAGALLLALVAVDNTETVMRPDASRGAPSAGYDSIVIPGRKDPSCASAGGASPASARFCEEYVIFDGSQALPLYLLHYEATLA